LDGGFGIREDPFLQPDEKDDIPLQALRPMYGQEFDDTPVRWQGAFEDLGDLGQSRALRYLRDLVNQRLQHILRVGRVPAHETRQGVSVAVDHGYCGERRAMPGGIDDAADQ